MDILIINCGSSSLSFKVYQIKSAEQSAVIAAGKARNVATTTLASPVIEWNISGETGSIITDLPNHQAAAQKIVALLKAQSLTIDAVGHRFVHGGTQFEQTTRIDPNTMERLGQCLHFAPIHNPNSFSAIRVCLEMLPEAVQYVVFDTAFHSSMLESSKQYALPRELADTFGYRKYGFHGLSYQFVSSKTAELMGQDLETLKLIICHLGTGGSSAAAVKYGRSLDTSMGYSPLPGLVMSSRCGDIDAEIVLDMVRNGSSADEVSAILNNQSGLIGLSGYSSNLEEIIEAAESGNLQCQLAYDVTIQRLKTYIGAYSMLLNGADAIVFTDDLGTRCWKLREQVCANAQNLGIEIDGDANRNAREDTAALLSRPSSKTQIWSVPSNEEQVILNEVLAKIIP